jgi:hypothetical protein
MQISFSALTEKASVDLLRQPARALCSKKDSNAQKSEAQVVRLARTRAYNYKQSSQNETVEGPTSSLPSWHSWPKTPIIFCYFQLVANGGTMESLILQLILFL